jgi:hypothetical protein
LHVGQLAIAGQEPIDVTDALETNLGGVAHLGGSFRHQVLWVLQIAHEDQDRRLGVDDEVPRRRRPIEPGALPQDHLLEVGRPKCA